MAEKPAAGKPGDGGDAKDDGTQDEPLFAVDDLIEQARVKFGVSPHIAAGALRRGGRKHYSEAEAAQRVEEFANMELGR